jgi:hypothetical protein
MIEEVFKGKSPYDIVNEVIKGDQIVLTQKEVVLLHRIDPSLASQFERIPKKRQKFSYRRLHRVDAELFLDLVDKAFTTSWSKKDPFGDLRKKLSSSEGKSLISKMKSLTN